MPKRITTYQYKAGDDPVTVAEQYGLTPQQLLDANPGSAPFSTGQTIKIPFMYQPNYLSQIEANRRAQQQAVTGAFSGVGTALRNALTTDTPYPGIANAGQVRD